MNAVLFEGRGEGQGTLQLSGTAMLLLGLTPLVFALCLLLTLLVSWWRSLFLVLEDPEAAPPGKVAPTPGAEAVGEECVPPQGGKGAQQKEATLEWTDNPLWPQQPQQNSEALRVRLAARYLHEVDALPSGWTYLPGVGAWDAPWVSPSGQRHLQDPREDAAAYMAHTLAAWEAGEDVLAMVPVGLVESVEARAVQLVEANELPPGWAEEGRGSFINARGERVQEDPRDASLFAYQEELAAALGVMALWRRQKGGIGRREQYLQW